MAKLQKTYSQPPALLLNLVNDIVEMRKARVLHADEDSLLMDTEMYGIRTVYRFHLARGPTGTTVTVETQDEGETAQHSVELMFATLDNLLLPFAEGDKGCVFI